MLKSRMTTDLAVLHLQLPLAVHTNLTMAPTHGLKVTVHRRK